MSILSADRELDTYVYIIYFKLIPMLLDTPSMTLLSPRSSMTTLIRLEPTLTSFTHRLTPRPTKTYPFLSIQSMGRGNFLLALVNNVAFALAFPT